MTDELTLFLHSNEVIFINARSESLSREEEDNPWKFQSKKINAPLNLSSWEEERITVHVYMHIQIY